MQDIETLWADFAAPIRTAEDYIASLRGRRMNVYFMGERVPEPVDHPVIRPSINAMAETFRLATEHPAVATVHSGISDRSINRFLHVPYIQASLSPSMRCSASSGGAPAPVFSAASGSMLSAPVTL